MSVFITSFCYGGFWVPLLVAIAIMRRAGSCAFDD